MLKGSLKPVTEFALAPDNVLYTKFDNSFTKYPNKYHL